MNLLRSEWVKLWTTRTIWTMLGIGLLVEGLFAGLFTGLAQLHEIENYADLATGTGVLLMLLLVLGVLVITTEFRHGTASSTFLASPRRYPALLAKLGIVVLIGLLAGLAYLVVNGGLAMPLFESRRGGLPPVGDLAEIYGGVIASFVLICAFGLGIGAIVRSQVGAIITAITFFFVVSSLPELLPGSISDYFPAQALGSLHGHQEGSGSLSQVGGGLVLAAWSAALIAIGTVLICRRDVAD